MSVHGLTNGFDPVHTRLVDFPSGHLWERTRITWTRRTPLLPKRRENTYKYEAVYEFERGLRGHVAYPVYTTTCTQFVRRTNGPAIWELVG